MTDASKALTAAVAFVVLQGGVQAQQSSAILDPVGGRTVDQLVATALERSPELLAARSAIDAARGQRQQAALLRNPLATTTWRERLKGSDHEAMFAVEWPLNQLR